MFYIGTQGMEDIGFEVTSFSMDIGIENMRSIPRKPNLKIILENFVFLTHF